LPVGEDTDESVDEDRRQSRELADAMWALGRFQRLWTAFMNHPPDDGAGRRSAAQAAFLAKGDVDALVARVFVSAGGSRTSDMDADEALGSFIPSRRDRQEVWSQLDH
jgi:hypothetical protein